MSKKSTTVTVSRKGGQPKTFVAKEVGKGKAPAPSKGKQASKPKSKGKQKPAGKPKNTGVPPSDTAVLANEKSNTVVAARGPEKATNVVSKVLIEVQPNQSAFLGVAATFVEYAIARGWKGRVSWDATWGLFNVLINAAAARDPGIEIAPRLFWDVVDALAPAEDDTFSYRFNVDSILAGVTTATLPTSYGNGLWANSRAEDTSGLIPGYDAHSVPPVTAILSNAQITAVQDLWTFYDSLEKPYMTGPHSENKRYKNSVDIYAAPIPVQGINIADDWNDGSSCGQVGLEGEGKWDIPWLAKMGLVLGNADFDGAPRHFSKFLEVFTGTRGQIAHRLYQGYSGSQGLDEDVRLVFFAMDLTVKDVYTVFASALNYINNQTENSDVSNPLPTPFDGIMSTTAFLNVVVGIIRTYFGNWMAVGSGLTYEAQDVTHVADWNWAPEVYQELPLPAVVIESLRSVKPVLYRQSKNWLYPLPTLPYGFTAMFNAWVTAMQSTGGSATPPQLLVPYVGTPTGFDTYDLVTGTTVGGTTPGAYLSYAGRVQDDIPSFQVNAQLCCNNTALYSGPPQHHAVEYTTMQYIEVFSFGLDAAAIAAKSRPHKWNRLRKMSLLKYYERRAKMHRRTLPPGAVAYLRAQDLSRGALQIEDEYDVVRSEPVKKGAREPARTVEKAPPAYRAPEKIAAPQAASDDLSTATVIGLLSELPVNAANFKSDTMFQFCYVVTTSPTMSDVAGVFNPQELLMADENALDLAGVAVRTRHQMQVHRADAMDNSEDGAVLKQRLALGTGGGTSSTSLMTNMTGLLKTGLDMAMMFL